MLNETRPVYTIGTAAEVLHVHPRTLRLYEDAGLIRPARKNNRRFYSAKDLEWVSCVRYMLHEQGLNQEGLRRLLALIPCWEINACPPEGRTNCSAWSERTRPCWDLARRSSAETKKCYQCDVYLSARDYLIAEADMEAALTYAPAA